MDTSRLLRTTGTVIAAAGLLLSGCTSGGSGGPRAAASPTGPASSDGPGPSAAPGAVPAGLRSYYAQKLSWHDCGVPGFQCATMKAPLDYAKPASGQDIDLAVARRQATGPGKRLGSLVVNPGGPGGSGIGYLQAYAGIGYPEPVRARYDMVSFDPRGVDRSSPVECLTGQAMDKYTQVDQTPDNPAEQAELVKAFKEFATGCQARSKRILPHVSTVDAARDMDMFRAVLGDEKLNYVGASYGTFLGATYADLFPGRVGRLVLDGAMDPSRPALELNRDQTEGFETAFRSFAKDCAKQPDCPLGQGGPDAVAERLKEFFRKVDAQPVPTGEAARPLGESLATTGVIAALYDETAWPQLREALTSAMNGDGSGLLGLADSYYEREADGKYANLMSANAAVNCLDQPPAFTGPEAVNAALPSFEKASPVFGAGLAWASLNCTYWPVKATGAARPLTAKGAAPIVVVGTVRDPATPYKWAQALAGQLDSGTLLTYDGDGHTAYGRGSDCIDSAINRYLLEGTPPADGKRC
ncbi:MULTISPECIES: alpha/beta hydrolase [unclassified Streptomyces]|uniref:alpha/beta hydrolase n=1 Tax=unclassified Streptomyces TaxID=2593676 RepID=UPI001BE6A5FF|nr:MULTISPECIES: alpha/beta hydrolase [unclassified Streptomyces]MBT2402226.1 alpha/beta fold hydrolase [Streptomyces sp. ISL-21]MBT2456254.1 alpha/beta fold hydrolase [Streptomyces sp. ISL-86]MBT2609412.1 alpha/beta fold hydrolase [Streptomyces sp. ISL-87]